MVDSLLNLLAHLSFIRAVSSLPLLPPRVTGVVPLSLISSSSLSSARGASQSSSSSMHSSLSSPSRRSRVVFMGNLRSPASICLFPCRNLIPCLSELAALCLYIGPSGGSSLLAPFSLPCLILYQHLGSWGPVLGLSRLVQLVPLTCFNVMASQSVLHAV